MEFSHSTFYTLLLFRQDPTLSPFPYSFFFILVTSFLRKGTSSAEVIGWSSNHFITLFLSQFFNAGSLSLIGCSAAVNHRCLISSQWRSSISFTCFLGSLSHGAALRSINGLPSPLQAISSCGCYPYSVAWQGQKR